MDDTAVIYIVISDQWRLRWPNEGQEICYIVDHAWWHVRGHLVSLHSHYKRMVNVLVGGCPVANVTTFRTKVNQLDLAPPTGENNNYVSVWSKLLDDSIFSCPGGRWWLNKIHNTASFYDCKLMRLPYCTSMDACISVHRRSHISMHQDVHTHHTHLPRICKLATDITQGRDMWKRCQLSDVYL